VDLGDITQNSWAVSTKLEPKEVMYYKVRLNRKIGELWQQSLLAHVPSNTSYLVLHPDQFTGPKTKGPFTISDTKNFFLGLYVPPGEKEKDFKFFVGIWGMSNETMECRRWGQGWGRRSGGDDHDDHDDHDDSHSDSHDHSHVGDKDGHDHLNKYKIAGKSCQAEMLRHSDSAMA
jgi:hypothetical protein